MIRLVIPVFDKFEVLLLLSIISWYLVLHRHQLRFLLSPASEIARVNKRLVLTFCSLRTSFLSRLGSIGTGEHPKSQIAKGVGRVDAVQYSTCSDHLQWLVVTFRSDQIVTPTINPILRPKRVLVSENRVLWEMREGEEIAPGTIVYRPVSICACKMYGMDERNEYKQNPMS